MFCPHHENSQIPNKLPFDKSLTRSAFGAGLEIKKFASRFKLLLTKLVLREVLVCDVEIAHVQNSRRRWALDTTQAPQKS